MKESNFSILFLLISHENIVVENYAQCQ